METFKWIQIRCSEQKQASDTVYSNLHGVA